MLNLVLIMIVLMVLTAYLFSRRHQLWPLAAIGAVLTIWLFIIGISTTGVGISGGS